MHKEIWIIHYLAISTFNRVDILTLLSEIGSRWKVIYFYVILNVYFCRSLWRTKETWFRYSLFTKYEYFNASQALKEGLWLRNFLRKLKVAERRIITCYFVIIWVLKSQSLYATWIHWRKELFYNHANCVGIHLLK